MRNKIITTIITTFTTVLLWLGFPPPTHAQECTATWTLIQGDRNSSEWGQIALCVGFDSEDELRNATAEYTAHIDHYLSFIGPLFPDKFGFECVLDDCDFPTQYYDFGDTRNSNIERRPNGVATCTTSAFDSSFQSAVENFQVKNTTLRATIRDENNNVICSVETDIDEIEARSSSLRDEEGDAVVPKGYEDAHEIRHERAIIYEVCKQVGVGNDEAFDRCTSCIDNEGGFWTAVGCIQTNPVKFLTENAIPTILSLATAIAALVGLMGLLFYAFGGSNQESVTKGKDMLTAAITGLLFVVFSMLLLQIIGIQIFQVPGFL